MLLTCKPLIHLELILVFWGFVFIFGFGWIFVCLFCFSDFWPFGKACGILVPQPEIEPAPPAVEPRVLTTGSPGKSLELILESSVRLRFERTSSPHLSRAPHGPPFPGLPASTVIYQSPTYAFSCFQALLSMLMVNLFIPVTNFQTHGDF